MTWFGSNQIISVEGQSNQLLENMLGSDHSKSDKDILRTLFAIPHFTQNYGYFQ